MHKCINALMHQLFKIKKHPEKFHIYSTLHILFGLAVGYFFRILTILLNLFKFSMHFDAFIGWSAKLVSSQNKK